MNQLLSKTVFFIGWVLSPLTFWNDAFVNIPLSYLIANLLIKFIKVDFLLLVLAAYWFTNVAGLAIMYATGKETVKSAGGLVKGVLSLLITSTVYSFILILLVKLDILKPF